MKIAWHAIPQMWEQCLRPAKPRPRLTSVGFCEALNGLVAKFPPGNILKDYLDCNGKFRVY